MPGPSDRDRQIDRPNEQESALDAAEMFHFILLQRKSEKEKRESPKSRFTSEALANIVLTMIDLSNSNKTRYQVGCQSRTNA